jgi:hypothetical protein
MIDCLALEPHFLDHCAPIWRALPAQARGRFVVDASLMVRASWHGITAETIDANAHRRTPHAIGGTDRPALVASIGDTKVARRMGYGPFVRLEHGAGQSYTGDRSGSYAGGPGNDDAELVLVPNAYSAALWRQAYPAARVEVIGSPRLDDLPARVPGPGPVLCVSFHWPGPGYAGTAFGEYIGAVAQLTKRYALIGHEHPNWSARRYHGTPQDAYRQMGVEFVAEFDDVCRRADVYVADNTSTLFEFAATGRPVIVLNSRVWSRSVNYGLRFWDAAEVGVNVDRPDELPAAIEEALADPPERQVAREVALGIVYQPRTNGAAAAATAILDWLAARQAVAA